jgi:hypothetical protein
MKRKRKLPFDPKVFLSANGGRSNFDYRKDQIDGHFRSWPEADVQKLPIRVCFQCAKRTSRLERAMSACNWA